MQHLDLAVHRSGVLAMRRRRHPDELEQGEDEEMAAEAEEWQIGGHLQRHRLMALCVALFPLIIMIVLLLGLLLASRQ